MRAGSIIMALLLSLSSFSQERCGTIAPPAGELENWIQEKIRSRAILNAIEGTSQTTVISIPVVVHVLHKGEPIGTGTNVSSERIIGQIDSLTLDFRRLNADTTNTPSAFQPIAADIEINFVLATQDPQGYPTNGIVRVNASDNFIPSRINDLIEMRSYSHWPAENYFNIYCTDLGSGLIGYATFPETDGPQSGSFDPSRFYLDGVFMDYEYFGTNPDAPAFESRGRTLTHEVGHFFGLRHIWGDGNCAVDDFIEDTPLADDDNAGYTSPCTFPNPDDTEVCVEDEPEMFQNYMDYTDDICMNLFTEGQKEFMRVVAENSPRRASLMNSPASNESIGFENDLAITSIISPDFATCDPQITPIIEVTNHGTNQVNQYRITLLVDSEAIFSISRNVTLDPFDSDILSFPNQIISGSSASIAFQIGETNEVLDGNAANDTASIVIGQVESFNLPFTQTFENENGMLGNFGPDLIWDVALAPSASPSNRAIVFKSFSDNRAFGQQLRISTPPMDLNAVDAATLTFRYAYSGKPEDMHDGLIVRGSTDCGVTYPDILFSEVGPDLQTVIPSVNEFVPSNSLEWREITINLSEYKDTDGVRIQFQGLNGSNNIYLDDIRVEQNNILANDISLESLRGPLVSCNENVDIELEVKNAGSDLITSFSVEGMVNGESFSQQFDGISIDFQEYQTFQLGIPRLTEQQNTISLNVGTVNGRIDESSISNSVDALVSIDANQDNFPLLVDFENENNWVNTSPENNSLWSTAIINGNTTLKASAFSAQTLGIQSWFVSPALSTGGLDSAGLFFRLSYANRPGFNDQFRVMASYDCGKTFEEVLLAANSDSLAITESTDEWIPTSDEDWKSFNLDLSSAIEIGDSIRIAFVMVNGNGNDLYLDDISIRGNDPPAYMEVFRIYPNPTTTIFNIGLNLPKKEPVRIEIIDIKGKLIEAREVENAFNQILKFETPINPGLYFVRITGNNFAQTQRLFVNVD